MKLNNLVIIHLLITMIVLFLTIVVSLSVTSVFYLQQEATNQLALESASECYQSPGQCGLHNALEEGDYSDSNLIMIQSWLDTNEFDLSDHELTQGIKLTTYLLGLTYEQRTEFIKKVQVTASEQYIQND